ncbi:TPA: serine protease [Staphylococcus aureus]
MKLKFNILLITLTLLCNLFLTNNTLANEGTQEVVTNTKNNEIGKRVALFDGPNNHSCTATMITPNIGLTAAHCGNGFKENAYVGRVSPAQSARETPYGSMNITLFNPYSKQDTDIAIIHGEDSDKNTSYKYYEKTFADKPLDLKGLSEKELSDLVGKKVFSLGYPYDFDGYKQYKFTGNIKLANTHAIHTTLPSYGGQSGSPVFLEENKQLIGVLIRSGSDNNNAILQPITKDIADWYKTKVSNLENTISS